VVKVAHLEPKQQVCLDWLAKDLIAKQVGPVVVRDRIAEVVIVLVRDLIAN